MPSASRGPSPRNRASSNKKAGTIQTRRERIEAAKAKALRRSQPQNIGDYIRQLPSVVWTVLITGLLVVLIIVLAIKNQGGGPGSSVTQDQTASPDVVSAITQIPSDTFATIQTGGLTNPLHAVTNSTLLTDSSGKPVIIYVGADYCPYCAAERWSLIAALSRFGTFQNLHTTTSSGDDVFPNTATFSFAGSQFTSQYLQFSPVETSDRDQNSLQTPTTIQQQALSTYDTPPYTSTSGSIPFISIANQTVATGSGYDPQVLTNLNWQQIAAGLKDPHSSLTTNIIGNANYLTAAICQVTQQKPAEVCGAAPIPAIIQQIGGH
jgi:thiol-disulfide isomerase/thioredoxin